MASEIDLRTLNLSWTKQITTLVLIKKTILQQSCLKVEINLWKGLQTPKNFKFRGSYILKCFLCMLIKNCPNLTTPNLTRPSAKLLLFLLKLQLGLRPWAPSLSYYYFIIIVAFFSFGQKTYSTVLYKTSLHN